MNNNFKDILNNDKLISIVDQAIVSGSHFLITLILAKGLGIEDLGLFAICWMVMLFASGIHQAFITIPMMSKFAAKENKGQYLKNLTATHFIFSSAVLMVGFIAAPFFTDLTFDVHLLIILTITYISHDFLRKSFYVFESLKKAVLLNAFVYGFQVAVILFFVLTGALTLHLALVIISATYGFGFIVFLLITPELFPSLKNIAKTLKEHFDYSKWLIGRALLQWFSGNYYILAGAALIGPALVGWIKIAQNVIGLFNVVLIAFEHILPGKAAKVFKEGNTTALVQFLKSFSIKAGAIAILALVAIFAGAEFLLKVIYGSVEQESIFFLKAYTVLYLFVCLALPFRIYFRTLADTSVLFIAYVIITLFSLLTANYFVSLWGISGVAIGLIGSQLLMNIIFFITYKIRNNENYTLSIG